MSQAVPSLAAAPTRRRPAAHLPGPAAPLHLAPRALALPGIEFPPVPPKHPKLPNPVPSLAQLEELAARAPADQRWTPGGAQALLRNAHYGNTRAQLGFALQGPYNSVEGDIRMRNGMPVMQHDEIAAHDLTFEQWAILVHRSGKHLRIDIKEHAALAPIMAILERIGVPQGSVTFNMSAGMPWSAANQSVDTIKAVRERFPDSWITINLALPFGPVYALATLVGNKIGKRRLGVTVTAGYVGASDVALLRTAYEFVNAWNEPRLKKFDLATEAARLQSIGVNGMIDLRTIDDPLATD